MRAKMKSTQMLSNAWVQKAHNCDQTDVMIRVCQTFSLEIKIVQTKNRLLSIRKPYKDIAMKKTNSTSFIDNTKTL